MIQSNDSGFRRKNDGPRRVRNGVRLRSREESPQFTWPSAPWFATLLGDTKRKRSANRALSSLAKAKRYRSRSSPAESWRWCRMLPQGRTNSPSM